jgi:anti-sigma factor RsiW
MTQSIHDEHRLLEFLDGQLPLSERQAVEAHLAACAQCETFVEQWRQLEGRLEAHLLPRALSAGFARRVWNAIENESSVGQLASAEKPEPLDVEWAAAWAEHRRRFLWSQLPGALDKVGFTLGAGVLILILWRLLIRFSDLLLRISDISLEPRTTLVGAGLTAVVLLAALSFAAKRPLTRMLAKL